MENIGTIILATGALGTASFGIVEALKIFSWLGDTGFGSLRNRLRGLLDALRVAYGESYEDLLRCHYKGPQRELARIIRQGARVGLNKENAAGIAVSIGFAHADALGKVADKLSTGKKLTEQERNLLGRYELAVDTRIEAALKLAQHRYVTGMRCWASVFSLVIAFVVYKFSLQAHPDVKAIHAVIVGIAAVPLAPIAKDLVNALQAAGTALKANR